MNQKDLAQIKELPKKIIIVENAMFNQLLLENQSLATEILYKIESETDLAGSLNDEIEVYNYLINDISGKYPCGEDLREIDLNVSMIETRETMMENVKIIKDLYYD